MNAEVVLRRLIMILLLSVLTCSLQAMQIVEVAADSVAASIDTILPVVPVVPVDTIVPVVVPIFPDTIGPTAANDTLEMIEKILKKPHSPHKATLMAMALPGSGQIYNGQWWKVPVLYGGVAADLYGIIWNNKRFKEYQAAFVSYTSYLGGGNDEYYKDPVWQDIPTPYPVNEWPQLQTDRGKEWFKTTLQNKKTGFKRNRDLCYIVMGAIYALNIIDACVFAHFYDFEIDDDLSINILPTSSYSPVSGGTLGVSLTFNF